MKVVKKIINYIYPNHCLYCEKIINKEAFFCISCWSKLHFISNSRCKICSYPIEFEGLEIICPKCLQQKPYFDKLISVFRYNYIIRKTVSNLKYQDQSFISKKLAKILYQRTIQEVNDFDIIISVPSHKKQLMKRKYNQATMLAKQYSKLIKNRNFYSDFLIKVKHTNPQTNLRKKERENNLNKAFELNKKYHSLIKNKRILLIDDVTTTGATLNNCAKILKKNGASKVFALTIAKTAFS